MQALFQSEIELRRFLQRACATAERLVLEASRKRCTTATNACVKSLTKPKRSCRIHGRRQRLASCLCPSGCPSGLTYLRSGRLRGSPRAILTTPRAGGAPDPPRATACRWPLETAGAGAARPLRARYARGTSAPVLPPRRVMRPLPRCGAMARGQQPCAGPPPDRRIRRGKPFHPQFKLSCRQLS